VNIRTEQFDDPVAQKLVIGDGAVDQLGDIAKALGGSHVLIVTDSGILAAGHVDRALASLNGLTATVFDQVRENPTTQTIDACLAAARDRGIDLIVGLGGGSSMDTAKGCNFLLTNGGNMADYWGIGKAAKPMLPMIAVPTTAGTGSECQSFALISDAMSHRKMACGDPKALPAVAVLDPSLTLTQPPHVAANSGIDALAHAVETAVTRKRNDTSVELSKAAFEQLMDAFRIELTDAKDQAARAAMQYGAALAGRAIELSMLGAAHAAANPLTARFDVVHGSAVGLMLPHVVRFNGDDVQVAAQYLAVTGMTPDDLADRLAQLLELAGLPARLADHGVDESHIDELAADAAEQWTGTFNPRPVDATVFADLYRAAR